MMTDQNFHDLNEVAQEHLDILERASILRQRGQEASIMALDSSNAASRLHLLLLARRQISLSA